MHAMQAAHIVNNIVFRPGWRFTAASYWPRPDDAILVDVTVETQDTNTAPDYRKRIIIAPGPFVIDVAGLDEDDLWYQIKMLIEGINDHEDREFLRDGRPGRGNHAPFHPHHREGELRWERQQRARYRMSA
jgi:hypothetical protein